MGWLSTAATFLLLVGCAYVGYGVHRTKTQGWRELCALGYASVGLLAAVAVGVYV